MMFAGCAQSVKEGISTDRQLPADCEYLAQEVPLPAVRKKDLGAIAAENRAAAVQANGNIRETRGCMVDQRNGLAGK